MNLYWQIKASNFKILGFYKGCNWQMFKMLNDFIINCIKCTNWKSKKEYKVEYRPRKSIYSIFGKFPTFLPLLPSFPHTKIFLYAMLENVFQMKIVETKPVYFLNSLDVLYTLGFSNFLNELSGGLINFTYGLSYFVQKSFGN